VVGLAIIVVGAVALYFLNRVRHDMAGQLTQDFEQDLRERVASWEKDVMARLHTFVVAANPYEADVYQETLRQTVPWVDALYLWQPAQQVTAGNRSISINGRLAFPEPPLVEAADAIARVDCLARARRHAGQPDVSDDEAVAAWRSWCRQEDASARLFAVSEAVQVYRRSQRWEDALQVLDEDGIPPQVTLSDAIALKIPPERAAILALQRADTLEALGRDDEAAALYFRTAMEITDLDGPDAERLLSMLAFPLLPRVREHGNEARIAMLEDAAGRAARRVNGYREVRDNLLPRRVPLVPENPRMVRDQYGDTPFLLYTSWASGPTGVALQLDEAALVEDFLQHMGRHRASLVVTDSTGRKSIAGARRGAPIALNVPFARTLTHLRVAMRSGPLRAQLRRLDREWMAGTVLVIAVLFVALGALATIVRTSRTQALLLVRQKEFATRVTHELKTPLAGIKVMAENLELGVYGTDRQRATMARTIVREADRLTQRVNEILAVTKERELRQPMPFDPEEPLFEVIEQWGPRMEVAEVRLVADLAPTDEILGDEEAFRDAVACLLDNALKYRREDVASCVELTAEQEGDRIVVAVTDNGLGVPADMREAIFDRFVRVEGDNRGRAGGHGLGLAQVVEIARAHGGSVRCEEGLDGGARFVLEVPAHQG
jgi:signal transduction histidine kinase